MAKRADAAPINRVPYVGMAKKVKGLAVLPKENECQGSQEKAAPVGIGVDKNQAAFTEWLRAVAKRMKPQLDSDERKIIDTL
jgi:polar amino acid transport system substrate-binding protein